MNFRPTQLAATLIALAGAMSVSAQTYSFSNELTTSKTGWGAQGTSKATWVTRYPLTKSYLEFTNIQGTQEVGVFSRALPARFEGKHDWAASLNSFNIKQTGTAINYASLYVGLVETSGWIASDFAGVRIADDNAAAVKRGYACLRDGTTTWEGSPVNLSTATDYRIDIGYTNKVLTARFTRISDNVVAGTSTATATGTPGFSWGSFGFGNGTGLGYASNGFSITNIRGVNFTGDIPIITPLVEPSYFQETQELLTTTPTVVQNGAIYQVTLNNGCRLIFDSDTVTLRAETPEGVTILANSPGRPFTLNYIPAGMSNGVGAISANVVLTFDRLTVLEKAATFHFELLSADGKESRLEWTFIPISQTINGKSFNGVGDTFLIQDSHHYLNSFTLYGLAATGSDYVGARSFRMACYSGDAHGYREVTFGGDPCNLGWWGAFIDGGQFFHVVGQQQGTLYEYLDDECHDMTLLSSNGANNAVEITHQLLLGRIAAPYRTPMRVRLFTSTPLSMQLWMELTRSRRQFFANKYSIPPTPIRPIFIDRNFFYNTSFEAYAETKLPVIRDLGFRRMEIGWIYKRGVAPAAGQAWPLEAQVGTNGKVYDWKSFQTEYKDVLLEGYGGAEAIRGLVDQAHAMGIEVYAWHQTAHGWRGSEDVRHHPDWPVYSSAGSIIAGSYAHCLVYFDLRSGFRMSTLKRIAEIRRLTNLDGFWLDMYGAGLHMSANYSQLIASPTVAERLEYVRSMREMGLGLYGEGISTVVIDSFEMLDNPQWEGHEAILYGTSPFLWRTDFFDKLDLFKLLSVQCIPTGPNVVPPGETEADRARLDRIRYRNRCFNLIEDNLGQPLGVVLTSQGSQWVHAEGNALFFYEPTAAKITLPSADATVLAVGSNGDIPVTREGNTATANLPASSLMIVVRTAARP